MNTMPINRILTTLFLLLLFNVNFMSEANANCETDCLTVYSISLTDRGTSIRGSVKLIDEFVNSGASRGSTVQVMWTRPDGSTILQNARIGTRLRADFNFGSGGVPGTYTFEVINVLRSGYTFDPSGGIDLVSSITVQNTNNQLPVAVINTDQVSGEAPLNINFDALSSHDPDGTLSSYHWDFGDGVTSYEPIASHTYTVGGVYTATLSILDDMGGRATSSVTINVTDPVPSGTGNCQSQCLSLDEFKMGFKNDMVIGKVRVMDENRATVYGVNIEAVWTLPDGSTVPQSKGNGSRKKTAFRISANQAGNYTILVTNVMKDGYQFVPELSQSEAGTFVVE